ALLLSLVARKDPMNPDHLNCADYWSEVAFSNFCGLSSGNFDFNTIPNDICNADQNSAFPFDDLISIRVYNHFSEAAAQEEYDNEKIDAQGLDGYTQISNLGDEAFAVLQSEFGELDFAIVQILKNNFSLYVEVNGNAANGANNCFDEASVIEFARALVLPL
ncbi:MAG: hypothetical protein KDC44_10605, partial [Phaeodactylibacter sp.]|nr:hypothetical protein [Phaeodactylibacter sp.]